MIDDRMQNLAKLLDVASERARVHAGNIANQNTPGYRARAVRFEEAFQAELDRHGDAAARQVEPEVYEPRETALDHDGNDVSLQREITLAAQNNLLYQSYISLLRGKHRLLNTAIGGGR